MKKLYFLNEEESKRILNLHKDATKRQYLSEATIKDNKLVFKNENPVTIKLYELLKYNTGGVNIDETKLVDAILEIPDLSTLTLVNTEITDIMNLVKKPYMAGLAKIFNDVLDYQWGDKDDIERLIDHLNKLGIDKETTRHLRSNDFVMPNLPSKDSTDVKDKEVPNNDNIPGEKEKYEKVKKTVAPCPVGDKKAVMAFQDWLDDNNKGWLPKYPDGLNSEPNKGYGLCGPSTRRAWANVTLKNAYVNGVSPQAETMVKKEVTTVQEPNATPELKTSTSSSGIASNDTAENSIDPV
jgi:hypothetical protein